MVAARERRQFILSSSTVHSIRSTALALTGDQLGIAFSRISNSCSSAAAAAVYTVFSEQFASATQVQCNVVLTCNEKLPCIRLISAMYKKLKYGKIIERYTEEIIAFWWLFHSRLKTRLFHKSCPPKTADISSPTAFTNCRLCFLCS